MWNKRNSNFSMNHALTFDQLFQPSGRKSWQWTAQDFSGGKAKSETFVIRFKYPSNAKAFMTAVLKNQVGPQLELSSDLKYSPLINFLFLYRIANPKVRSMIN